MELVNVSSVLSFRAGMNKKKVDNQKYVFYYILCFGVFPATETEPISQLTAHHYLY